MILLVCATDAMSVRQGAGTNAQMGSLHSRSLISVAVVVMSDLPSGESNHLDWLKMSIVASK